MSKSPGWLSWIIFSNKQCKVKYSFSFSKSTTKLTLKISAFVYMVIAFTHQSLELYQTFHYQTRNELMRYEGTGVPQTIRMWALWCITHMIVCSSAALSWVWISHRSGRSRIPQNRSQSNQSIIDQRTHCRGK